jgi:hypothetical protein
MTNIDVYTHLQVTPIYIYIYSTRGSIRLDVVDFHISPEASEWLPSFEIVKRPIERCANSWQVNYGTMELWKYDWRR